MTDNYNLLDEDWIPVLYHDGTYTRVGIRKALEDAGRIRQIAASNPMDRLAILRFLLALLYWCEGNPPDEMPSSVSESLPCKWYSKIEDHRDSFNLFGEGKRFYQDPGARRDRAVTDLIQEVPTGNNFRHFRHSTDKTDGLCHGCCAIGLLRLPLFSVSGLPDLKAGINGTPPIYLLPCSGSLKDTLIVNWVEQQHLGVPAWITVDNQPSAGEVVPVLVGLTVLARRVWLNEPSEPSGSCVLCGTRQTHLTRTCQYETAGKLENILWSDPHVIYSDEKPRTQKAQDLTASRRFKMDRPWPDLLSRLISSNKFVRRDESVRLLAIGFATDKAKNIDVWERLIDIPSGQSIHEDASEMLKLWPKECSGIEKRLAKSRLLSESAVSSIRPAIEHSVSEGLQKLLCGGETTWNMAGSEYCAMMEVIAESLSLGPTTSAIQNRWRIASTRPSMQRARQRKQKPRTGKGRDS